MKYLLFTLAASGLVLTPQLAFAQDPAPANAAPAPASIDPERLAAARITIDHIFPTGTYARVMEGTVNGLIEKALDSSTQVPLAEIAALSGRPASEIGTLGKGTLAEILAIYDPAYHERMNLFTHSFVDGLRDLMTQFEPSLRDGMAEAYAKRFTLAQLADMNRFFATPSGQAYAANAMTIQSDPAVASRMQAIFPRLFAQMPAIMEKAKQATAGLPAQRKFSELSAADRVKLAGLLGVPEAQLEANAAKK